MFSQNKPRFSARFYEEHKELRSVLDEKFVIKKNNGPLPDAQLNLNAMQTWVYPADKTFRTYQFKIVRSALFQNTLVTLPTGLGKTFIASTVMFNYYRWFTDGLIFFVAPTRPLVMQQADAFCTTISEVPLGDIEELTGSINKSIREKAYATQRIFFMTPQTLQNDIEANIVPMSKVTLVVIDEAHRAAGNYAYCKIIEYLEKFGAGFRIVALSATPVSKIESLQTIVDSLRCCKFEVRDEDDDEVRKFTFNKNIIEILVDKEDGISVLENHVNKLIDFCLQFLKTARLIGKETNARYVNRMTILNLQNDIMKKQGKGSYVANQIGPVLQRTGTIMSLCHGKKLLATHGYESFAEYIDSYFDLTKKDKKNVKFLETLKQTPDFTAFMLYLTESRATKNHPKLRKLAEILINFFKDPQHATNSKVIIFSQFRESAKEIKAYLDLKTNGLVKSDIFIGQQKNGLTQNGQAVLIDKFKKGLCNTLVATCVAEEGLDIGDVNLIISYDCLASPIRMVQRFGRTGRAGVGEVIVLIQRGEEENKFRQSKHQSKVIMSELKAQCLKEETKKTERQQTTLDFGQKHSAEKDKQNQLNFFELNSRMIPDDVHSKPIYRKLQVRSKEELEKLQEAKAKFLKLKKEKPRKSQSANPTKQRKRDIKKDDEITVYSEGEQLMEPEATEIEVDAINEIFVLHEEQFSKDSDDEMDEHMEMIKGIMGKFEESKKAEDSEIELSLGDFSEHQVSILERGSHKQERLLQEDPKLNCGKRAKLQIIPAFDSDNDQSLNDCDLADLI